MMVLNSWHYAGNLGDRLGTKPALDKDTGDDFTICCVDPHVVQKTVNWLLFSFTHILAWSDIMWAL